MGLRTLERDSLNFEAIRFACRRHVPISQTSRRVAFLLLRTDIVKTIFRSKLTNHFTPLPNAMLRDKTLSFKARGILAMVLTNKEEWEVSKTWLQEQGTEGREAITSGLDELKKAGYVSMRQERGDSNKFDRVIWEFRDMPDNGKPSDGESKENQPNNGNPHNGDTPGGKAANGKPLSGKAATKKEHRTEKTSSETAEAAPDESEKPKVPAPVEKDENPHQTFIKLWTDGYKVRFEREYTFQGAKDGNAVKMLLAASKLTPQELFAIAKQAWDRMHLFGCKRATNIAAFLSSFNEIREEIATGNPASKLPAIGGGGRREYVLGARPPQSGGWDSNKFRAQAGLATAPAEQVNGHSA